ncbi:MAG: PDCD5-related protein [Monoraphidium minutum]|nr:MAG: PDCD5-related protein [Monoraphidium minutum]
MEDSELDAIRQRRMAELARQRGGAGAGGAPGPMTPEEQEEQEAAKQAAEDQRRGMLVAVMMPEARERLARIALVKPDKARSVENMILAAAQRGAITEKVSEDRLRSMLEQISERDGKQSKITIQRRRPMFEEDD